MDEKLWSPGGLGAQKAEGNRAALSDSSSRCRKETGREFLNRGVGEGVQARARLSERELENPTISFDLVRGGPVGLGISWPSYQPARNEISLLKWTPECVKGY